MQNKPCYAKVQMYYKYKADPPYVNTKRVNSNKDNIVNSIKNGEQSTTFYMHIYT